MSHLELHDHDHVGPQPPAEIAAAVPVQPITKMEIAAYLIVVALLLFVFYQHLVVGLLAGLLFYKILDFISVRFARVMSRRAARPLSLILTTLVAGAILVGGGVILVGMLKTQANNIPALMTKMAEILESTRVALGTLGGYVLPLPDAVRDAEDLKQIVVGWLKEHAGVLKIAGGTFGVALIHIVMGLLLAVLVFFRHLKHEHRTLGPLSLHLMQKVHSFAEAFTQIVVAQVKISAVNTILTAIYLLVILPLFGKDLPFAGTIIVVTFVCGLLPVIGNLISNTVITIVSLGVSLGTAIASLTFLIVIHKLEYLVNSRIVGMQTSSQAWEILMAIIIGEAAFGVQGVVMAPIIYAFTKNELRRKALI
jgi:predicted PurR-regulated permease PerM